MIDLNEVIIKLTGAQSILSEEDLQTLWSGYGKIRRYKLEGAKYQSVIVKHIDWSDQKQHPRGWNTSMSHQRKVKSYQVENRWYQQYAHRTNDLCKIPMLYHHQNIADGLLLIMEDLDARGFDLRYDPTTVRLDHVKSVLTWLANFHATFMDMSPTGLWELGTYWHLDTRPDEWEQMQNKELQSVAKAIDSELNRANYQTLIHGDAKFANFCFSATNAVAAVDFQYVGGGCGMKDVAYLLSSCFEEADCKRHEAELMHHYFEVLKAAVGPEVDFAALQAEWAQLYAFAWADFYRFLDGWSPGHWKMHGYSTRLTQQVIQALKQHDT